MDQLFGSILFFLEGDNYYFARRCGDILGLLKFQLVMDNEFACLPVLTNAYMIHHHLVHYNTLLKTDLN